jgi:hypothetical protein
VGKRVKGGVEAVEVYVEWILVLALVIIQNPIVPHLLLLQVDLLLLQVDLLLLIR